MAIRIEGALREGWKATQNSRFGEALEVRFIHTDDMGVDKIIFRYAPCLEDKARWEDIFKWLETYDNKIKEIRCMTDQLNLLEFLSKGQAKKEPVPMGCNK